MSPRRCESSTLKVQDRSKCDFSCFFCFGIVLFPSLCFFVWAVCAFRAPAARFWCSGVFLLRRVILRGHFWRRVSFWHLLGIIFHVFLSLGPAFWSVGDPPGSFFASRVRKGTHLRRLAPPGHQLAQKQGHQLDFPPSPWSVFSSLFVVFLLFQGFSDFVKTEPPLKRELNFEGPGSLKM